MRSGRFAAQRLGRGTLVNTTLTAKRRVFTLFSASVGTAYHTITALTFTQGQTLMATIEAIDYARLPATENKATASMHFVINSMSGGTFTIREGTGTLIRSVRLLITVIGRPDPNRIVD